MGRDEGAGIFMKNYTQLILLSLILLTACGPAPAATSAPATETALPTRQVTPMPTSTPTYKSSPTMTITMTPMSTLSAIDAENEIATLSLDNSGCTLPCFWGLTPGITKMESFSSFLKRFNLVSSSTELVLPQGDLLLSANPTAQGGYKGDSEIVKWIDVDLRAYPKNESKQKMIYGAPGYLRYFKYYSLQNLLATYGSPEQAYVVLDTGIADMGLGEDLFLLSIEYPSKWWMAVFEMPLWQKGTALIGCPSEALVHLRLWSPGEQLPGSFYGGFGGSDKSYLFTINEATGMTMEEFYQKFKDPSNTSCLETPPDIHK
jgi:hypothetical protein